MDTLDTFPRIVVAPLIEMLFTIAPPDDPRRNPIAVPAPLVDADGEPLRFDGVLYFDVWTTADLTSVSTLDLAIRWGREIGPTISAADRAVIGRQAMAIFDAHRERRAAAHAPMNVEDVI